MAEGGDKMSEVTSSAVAEEVASTEKVATKRKLDSGDGADSKDDPKKCKTEDAGGPSKSPEKKINYAPPILGQQFPGSREHFGQGYDRWSYTRSGDFTSEVFKIKVTNLPKVFGFSELKKRFMKEMGIKPHKIKSTRDNSVAYICFRNENQRQRALEKVNKHVWKGKTLQGEEAGPCPDPYYVAQEEARQERYKPTRRATKPGYMKRSQVFGKSGKPAETLDLSEEETIKMLRDNVTPLWQMEYPEQLESKHEKCKEALKKLAINPFLRTLDGFKEKVRLGEPACTLLDIVPSPEQYNYRNKNEFAIGHGVDGKTITVGFRFGMYKCGSTAVGSGACLNIARPQAERVARSFEKVVTQSNLPFFQYHTGRGHWQTMMVRTFETGETMVMVDFVKADISQERMDKLIDEIRAYYKEGDGKDIDITSFYLRITLAKGVLEGDTKILIFGEKFINERLFGLTFRVSAEAFFQVNTKATEKLYGIVKDWARVGENTVVLDVCCGTGTIGLSMAKEVKEVIGIDNCQQAIDDAKANAELNGITNATYYCNKVEDVIGKIMTSFPPTPERNLVAVVDPPRPGLHKNVLRSLRKNLGIQRLIYVSCNPDNCLENFADLIRLPTNNLPAKPFDLVKAIPVDLFPNSRHCELVLLFERDTTAEVGSKDS